MRLPASRAESTTPSAVPWPAVASAPVLQWVRTRAPSGTRAAPARPIARFVSTSARKRASAASASLSAATAGSPCFASTARMRSSAQNRLTAVGRLSANVASAACSASENWAGALCLSFRASSATPKAAAQPIAGAPRTAIARIATATSAALEQLRYSKRAGSSRWSISSRRPSRQRSVSTAVPLDDAFIAAVHRYLRAGGLGEKRAAHLGRQLGDVGAADLGAQNVVLLVRLHRHPVLLRALREHFLGPQRGVEHRVGVQGIDADAVSAPLERGNARELVERGLGRRVGGGAGPGRGNVLR